MGRARGTGAVLGTALLLPFFVASTPSFARAQTASAVSPSVVNQFTLFAEYERHHRSTLTEIRAVDVTPNERATIACSDCGATRFAKKVQTHRVLFSLSPPLHMRSSTRVIVGATAHKANGRWVRIGFDFDPKKHRYVSRGHGCMQPYVTSMTHAYAARPSTIPTAPCGAPPIPETEDVYWRGIDGQLWEQQYTSQNWQPPSLPGSGHTLASAPAAVVLANRDRDVFWEGTDGWLFEMSFTASTGFWSNPKRLPRRQPVTSAPSAVVDAHGVVRVFFRAQDGFIWQMAYRGRGWPLPWQLNSGVVKAAPAAVALPDGSLELFWWAGGLWEMHYPNQGVGHKLPGAGQLGSAPTAVLDSRDSVHVYWKGTNGWLWQLSNPDSGSGSVQLNSGPLGSAPSAVIYPNNAQDVFWRGSTGGGLWEKRWYAKQWHPSAAVPYAHGLGSAPAVVMVP